MTEKYDEMEARAKLSHQIEAGQLKGDRDLKETAQIKNIAIIPIEGHCF